MLKPLREEQADMRQRWSDPSYRWIHDSALRRKLDRNQSTLPSSVPSTGCEAEQGTQKESEGTK